MQQTAESSEKGAFRQPGQLLHRTSCSGLSAVHHYVYPTYAISPIFTGRIQVHTNIETHTIPQLFLSFFGMCSWMS